MTSQTLKGERRAYVSLARWVLIASCWLYAGGVVLQVFAVGMVFLSGQGGWLETHRMVGHGLGLVAVAAPLAGFFGRLPRSMLVASFGLFVLHGLQYAFIESGTFVRAFHAVNAVLLFWLAVYLGQVVLRSLRRPS